MHRDLAWQLVFLAVVHLVTLAAGPAPLTGHRSRPDTTTPLTLLPSTDETHHRHCRRRALRPRNASAPPPGRGDLDPTQPRVTRSTRRGRRGPSARRRGSRGGQAWRGSTTNGRRHNLLLGLINIQSLLPKTIELQHDHLNRLNYDFCALTETWLRPATDSRLVTFPGYTLTRADRPGGAGYGGVAILSRECYPVSVISQPVSECVTCKLESLWLRVKPKSGSQFSIAAVYRPPRRTVAAIEADISELEQQYQRVLLHYPGPILIMGDLKCNMLEPGNNAGKDRLCEMIQSFQLHQYVKQPTFVSGSLLDVVMCNETNFIRRLACLNCAFSPHHFIRTLLFSPKCRNKPVRIHSRLLKRIDRCALYHDLYCVDWSGVFSLASVADQWKFLLDNLLPIIDSHAPIKRITIRNPRAPAVSAATLDLMALRRGVLRREWRTAGYRDIDRRVRAAIRHDCRSDIQERLRNEGSSSLYRVIRPVIAGKVNRARDLPVATPDEMNDFFVSVGPRVAASLAGLGPPPDVPCRLPRVGACGFRVTGITLHCLREIVFSMSVLVRVGLMAFASVSLSFPLTSSVHSCSTASTLV